MEPELSSIFLSKNGCQKYSASLVTFLFLAKYGNYKLNSIINLKQKILANIYFYLIKPVSELA